VVAEFWYISRVKLFGILFGLVFVAAGARAQDCPSAANEGHASAASVLRGVVTVHHELRDWLGLKLESPVCGQREVQLVFAAGEAYRNVESFRECTVTATGKLFEGETGYYSADVALSEPVLKPDGSCHPYPVRTDPKLAPLPKVVSYFRVSIRVDFRGKGHVEVEVRGENQEKLESWESFAYYQINGGRDMLWFGCREGFRAGNAKQNPKVDGGIIEEPMGMMGAALDDSRGVNEVEFVCSKMDSTVKLPTESH
jgi:hypothetical protein